MTQPNLAVQPDDLRRHARTIAGLSERTDLALQAATYIAAADDGFGAFPRPFVKMLLDDNHQGAVDAIAKLTREIDTVPGKLQANANAFEDGDKALGTSISTHGAPIAQAEDAAR
jgi:hypothetical protein